MHRHIKPPDGIIPIKLICDKICDKNKRYEVCQAFYELFSVHPDILPHTKEKTPIRKRADGVTS